MHAHLPRLEPEHYRGLAMVHWTLTVEERATGWLDELFHAKWREVMLHAVARYGLLCPAYCLMADHAHVIWIGVAPTSDQRNGMKFFRGQTSPLLAPRDWQRQPYDNVLREHDRERGAFASVCNYVLDNPVRKGQVARWDSWIYSGAMVPGYPRLDPRQGDFWELFWQIYEEQLASHL